MSDELIIEQKELKGDDGFKIFSIRVSESNFKRIEKLSEETNQSRNALINAFIEYGLEHCKVKKKNDK